MTTLVAVSSTKESDYSYLLPFACLLWREVIGFEPVVLLVGDEREWAAESGPKACLSALRRFGFVHRFVGRIEGHTDVAMSKHSRQHLAAWSSISDDTWIIPSDADLWPFQRSYYQRHEAPSAAKYKAMLYYANGDAFESGADAIAKFEANRRFFTIPMCHVAMRAREWRSSYNLLADDLTGSMRQTFARYGIGDASNCPDGETEVGWTWWVNSDQRVLTYVLAKQPWFDSSTHYVVRVGRPPIDRLDRSTKSWSKGPLDLDLYVDAHVHKKPETAWQDLEPIIARFLPNKLAWAEGFHRAWTLG